MIRYQITNGRYSSDPSRWMDKLRSDVDYIQIRERDLGSRELAELARRVMMLVEVPVLLNDRIDVAVACGAAGVHLRSNSISPRDVKARWPLIVSVACHGLEDAKQNGGADFAILAPIFQPLSKQVGQPALGLAALSEFVRASAAPVLALGGITAERIPLCLEAGAAGIAGITLFNGEPAQ